MRNSRVPYLLLIAMACLMVAGGCSVEKNTSLSRFYHNLTARYNIYHNGTQSYRAGIKRIAENHSDDYSLLLPVFDHSDEQTVAVADADMERAIQKASIIITQKSITARPERRSGSRRDEEFYNRREYNRWVDNAYLLMAKARFHRHQFDQARASINLMREISLDDDIINEGIIWLARIHTERGNYSEALRTLGETGGPSLISRSLRPLYHSTLADIYLRQGDYARAIEPLALAAGEVRDRRQRYRLTFLKAQLYAETGNVAEAIRAYEAVVGMRPPYEAEFNARINMAGVVDSSAGDAEDIMRQLRRMLRDEKNREYLDQIYLAKGDLAARLGDTDSAVDYYHQAAAASSPSTGGGGAGRAYLALATYYYDKTDFFNAGLYYDSAMAVIDERYPDFDEISRRADNLGLLVRELAVIRHEDSLRMVALMSPQQRSNLIAGIIERERASEQEGRATQQMAYNLGQFYESERRFRDNIQQEGSWYFYNQTALAFGRSEFSRRWGDRPLEDNWRRSNRREVSDVMPGEETGEEAAGEEDRSGRFSHDYYMANLPLNDSLFLLSEMTSAGALYRAGTIYKERLGEDGRAAGKWVELVENFPGHQDAPAALYKLYLLYADEDASRSDRYRQRLLDRHPESHYARLLTDPDFIERERREQERAGNLYRSAYENYQAGRYEEAAEICRTITAELPDHEIIPMVRLLYALTYGARGDEQAYWQHLTSLVRDFPETDQAVRASEMMDAIGRERPEIRVEHDREIVEELYSFEPGAQHLFVLLITNPGFNINRAVFDVINHNIDTYRDRNFRADGQLVDGRFVTVTVGRFEDSRDALEYYRAFDALSIVRDSSPETTMTFVITAPNLETLRNDRDPERYMLFFREYYLNEDVGGTGGSQPAGGR